MDKIKVIHMADSLHRGGLEKVVAMIAHGLDREKFDVEIWCMDSGGVIADELRKEDFSVTVWRINSYRNPINIFRLASRLRKNKTTIVHLHGFFCSVIGTVAAVLAGVPVRIVHMHTTLHHFTRFDVIKHRIVNRFIDKIIFISKSAHASSLQVGCGYQGKGMVIYNGVDGVLPRNQTADKEKNVITMVASLNEHKGHTYLLKAIQYLVKEFPDVNLWIIGQGPLKITLEQEAKDLGIQGHVTFWGERNDVVDLIEQSTICVLSSLREGLPLAILEAMAQGKPVVAHRIGGVPEAVEEGVTGFLVEPKNTRQFSEKLSLLLSDQDLQGRMGQQAREAFKRKFSSEIMIHQIEKVYTECVQSKLGV